MSTRKGNRLDWWLFRHLSRVPGLCVAKLHGLLIWRTREDPRINAMCRRDLAANGSCWCGKLRDGFPVRVGDVGTTPTPGKRDE